MPKPGLILQDGATLDQVFEAWRTELLRHRVSAKNLLEQRAIDFWSERKNMANSRDKRAFNKWQRSPRDIWVRNPKVDGHDPLSPQGPSGIASSAALAGQCHQT